MELCKKILEARKSLGKSQEAIARQMGMSRNAYVMYELGQLKPKNTRLLEKVLKLPCGSLEERLMSSAEQVELITTAARSLLNSDALSDVEFDAFVNEMYEIIEDAKRSITSSAKV